MSDHFVDHTVICSYGVCGAAVVSDLLAAGHSPGALVVIDAGQASALVAARLGVLTIVGDAPAPRPRR